MFYTREQCNRLEKYRKTFETVVNSGFARNVGSIALKEIEQIYDEAYGSHYSYNSGCSVCVLSFLKRVGQPFLQDSAAYAEQDRIAAEEEALNKDMELNDGMETEEILQPTENEPVMLDIVEVEPAPVQEAAPEKPKRTRKKKENIENGTEQ